MAESKQKPNPAKPNADVDKLVETNAKLLKRLEELEKQQVELQKKLDENSVAAEDFAKTGKYDERAVRVKRESKKQAILKKWENDPKVLYVISPVGNEIAGESTRRIQVNGVAKELPVGVQLELPKSIVDLLVEAEVQSGRLKNKAVNPDQTKEGVTYREALDV